MKKVTILFSLFSLLSNYNNAQVSISDDNSNPNPAAMLDVKSTNKGFLPPRLSTEQRDQISSPPLGLVIFNTDCEEYQYYKSTGWKTLGNSSGQIASPGVINGITNLCSQVTGVIYSAAAVPDAANYTWTVPAGATVISGQGTNSIVVNFSDSGGSLCVTANNACYNSAPTCIPVIVTPSMPASVSISTNSTTVCAGILVTFSTIVTNGGSAPLFQWKKNNLDIAGATNATYSYFPENNDQISCRMVSNCLCPTPPIAYSNYLTMMVINSAPGAPTEGIHIPASYQITWNWNMSTNAAGYKWNIINDYSTAADLGIATTKTETGLACNTNYTRYVWAFNSCGNSTPVILNQSTSATCPFSCGVSTLLIHHVTSGGVAPLDKTTTYGTTANIPGELSKCWITNNLGSDHPAVAVNDPTEASSGWYWQFNRKQGFKHDGAAVTPSWTTTSISENSDWLIVNDPCKLELDSPWRVPTYTEWYNVDNTGGWINWNGPWGSGLQLHAAGYINSNGSLFYRGSGGYYWSSSQLSSDLGWHQFFYSGYSYMDTNYKSQGFCLRCIRE